MMDAVDELADYIARARDYAQNGHTKLGIITSEGVMIGGSCYEYVNVTDDALYPGSYVYCVKSTGNRYVVVGT